MSTIVNYYWSPYLTAFVWTVRTDRRRDTFSWEPFYDYDCVWSHSISEPRKIDGDKAWELKEQLIKHIRNRRPK